MDLQNKLSDLRINIRVKREFRGYSQEWMGTKLGISQNAYSKMELGYTEITVERLYELARILEYPLLDFIGPKPLPAAQILKRINDAAQVFTRSMQHKDSREGDSKLFMITLPLNIYDIFKGVTSNPFQAKTEKDKSIYFFCGRYFKVSASSLFMSGFIYEPRGFNGIDRFCPRERSAAAEQFIDFTNEI